MELKRATPKLQSEAVEGGNSTRELLHLEIDTEKGRERGEKRAEVRDEGGGERSQQCIKLGEMRERDREEDWEGDREGGREGV